MERSELIPQTTEDLGSGHLFYHFSLSTNETNAPSPKFEHQIAFFEVSSDGMGSKATALMPFLEPLHRAQVWVIERRLSHSRQHTTLVREQ